MDSNIWNFWQKDIMVDSVERFAKDIHQILDLTLKL